MIAQGREAGGHVRGHTSIWELLPACVDALAGAQGVSLGTAFLAAAEANVHPEYRSRVLAATADDTVLTADLFDVGWPDAPHRTLRGKTFEEWDAAGRPPSGHRPGEGSTIGRLGDPINADVRRYAPMMTTSSFVGDVGYAPLWAGESVGAVHAVEPAADIVHRLARDASAMIEAGNSEGSRTV